MTERELQTLELMAEGKSNKIIARTLTISEGTVKTHVKHVLEKLAVQDRTQAVTAALRRGFVQMV